MVGMNSKSNEPRGGTSGSIQHSKKQPIHGGGHNKTQPPVEALQMARILDDGSPITDIEHRIHAVLSIVPGRSSEEVNIALHDNDFDVEKAISALLDSDVGTGTGEWTTTARKGKKKEGSKVESDLISASGEVKSAGNKSSRSSRGTNNAGSSREGFGGGVSVTGDSKGTATTPKGGKGSGQSSGGRNQDGRGRSQSGRRSLDKTKGSNSSSDRRRDRGERGDRRERGGDRGGDRGERGGDRGDRGERGFGGRSNRSARIKQHNQQNRTTFEPGEVRTSSATLISSLQQEKLQKLTAGMNSWETDSWDIPPQTTEQNKVDRHLWDIDNEDPPIGPTSTTPLFPDALPPSPSLQPHTPLTGLSTAAETTPNLTSVGEGSERDFIHIQASEQRQEAIQANQQLHKVSGRRQKRLARSRIPTKPVEMPEGVDSLDLEFGQLGIDFIGSEQESRTTPTSTTPISTGFTSPTDRRAVCSEVQRLAEDPSVLSVVPTVTTPSKQSLSLEMPPVVGVAQTYSHQAVDQPQGVVLTVIESVETKKAPIDGPPGLTRPASVSSHEASDNSQPLSSSSQQQQHQQQQHQQQQHQQQQQPLPLSAVPSSTSSMASKNLGLSEASLTVSTGGVALQLPPEPIELPHQQAQIQSSHNQGHYQVTSSNSDLLMSTVTATSSAVNIASGIGVATSSSTHLRSGNQHSSLNSSSQHSALQQQHASKPVPPGMMYPHLNMMHAQYPFNVMPVYPPNYGDPNELNRYPASVSMAYYSSSDPTLVAAMTRDHSSSAFGGTDQSKYGRMTVDGTSPVSSHQQTQGTGLQQGQHLAATPFMNYPPAYGFYHPAMYPMAAGFSATHTLAPKPSASGSNLTSYQHHQSGAFGGYDDMLTSGGGSATHDQFSGKIYGSSLSKSSSLPTTTSGDAGGLGGGTGVSSSSFKHNYDGSKSSSGSGGYNYNVPSNQYIGTYMGTMGMPTIPMHHPMQTAATQVLQGNVTHDSTGGVTRGGIPSGPGLQKHGNKGVGYQSGLWSQGGSHS